MKIELTEEEIGILNGCLLKECMEISRNKTNQFIDLNRLEKYEKEVFVLMNKLNK